MQRFEHEYHLVAPKSTRSRRTVMLPSVARSALEGHHVRQQRESARAGELWQEHGLVFTTATGQPMDATGVTSGLQRHLLRAGLRRQRFHDRRHACASLLLSRGVSPRVVTEVLGHSQISRSKRANFLLPGRWLRRRPCRRPPPRPSRPNRMLFPATGAARVQIHQGRSS
ncbi:MAG: tyrosine-type recombinase/integrase [Candidatus Dormibacteria bacterium]